jgi:hypothetical protein
MRQLGCASDCIQNCLCRIGLPEKGGAASVQRLVTRLRFIMRGHEDDRNFAAFFGKLSLQLEPGHSTQLHIQQQAISVGSTPQKFFSGEKAVAFDPGGGEKPLNRAAQARVVIDDRHPDRWQRLLVVHGRWLNYRALL